MFAHYLVSTKNTNQLYEWLAMAVIQVCCPPRSKNMKSDTVIIYNVLVFKYVGFQDYR